MSASGAWQDKKTIGQMLSDTVAKFGGRGAWLFKDERLTYRGLRERVDRLAGGLLRLGVKKGDKVSIWMPNCLESGCGRERGESARQQAQVALARMG